MTVKYMTYLAGGMENVKKSEMIDHREIIEEKLLSDELFIYNPIRQEAEKVGSDPGEHIRYVQGLKRGGHWKKFFSEMWAIWFGTISQNTDIIQLMINLRMRKHIDGNNPEEAKYWGDVEAVVRSDFVIVHYPTSVKTVGTNWECFIAMLFKIPIYLIVPDAPATNVNSTLLFGNMISNNQTETINVYRTISECTKAIIEKYNLKIEEFKKKEEK